MFRNRLIWLMIASFAVILSLSACYTIPRWVEFLLAWNPNPNEGWLASTSNDNKIQLWEPHTGRLMQTLMAHTDNVNSVAWSPDGKTLASASDDKTIRLWQQIATRD